MSDLDRFYALLDELAKATGGPRLLGTCCGRDGWPARGVYFFFEPGQVRASDPTRPRVVRVGTHAVGRGTKTTLWSRLRAHRGSLRGNRSGGGNHRGSVFRLHVGMALLGRDGGATAVPTWGVGENASREVRQAELALERRVSDYIGRMSVLWLPVDDEAGVASDRRLIEKNAVALLSGPGRPVDPPSADWLGRHSPQEKIRTSGLWNVNDVGNTYSPDYFRVFERHIPRRKPDSQVP